MVTFNLRIESGDSALMDDPAGELARILDAAKADALAKLAHRASVMGEDPEMAPNAWGWSIRDINGNKVGWVDMEVEVGD
jgi:hypothetical protein